jgi:hypothetical protein
MYKVPIYSLEEEEHDRCVQIQLQGEGCDLRIHLADPKGLTMTYLAVPTNPAAKASLLSLWIDVHHARILSRNCTQMNAPAT